MPTADEVEVEFKARVSGYEANLKRAAQTFEQTTGKQRNQMARLERDISRNSAGISKSLKGLAASFAAGFSAQQVAKLADSFTRFTNQLKVAGLEGAELGAVQDRLAEIANRNGVQIEAVGTLYSRAAQNQKELGASTEDLISLTRAVSASLRISGTSANEAAGSLLQLGQALGSPRVQAEEFNSLLDTMQPLLRGAAKYIDGTGGALSGLTRKIKDTQGPGVSNIELFRAIVRAMAEMEKQANSATLTIGASFQILENKLSEFIGKTDSALGVTERVSEAIKLLADNLGTVANALAVVGAIMLGRYAVGMLAAARSTTVASAAIFAVQARALGAATSLEALTFAGTAAGRSLLAAFGGPVGLAITALTVGIGYLVEKHYEAEAASEELKASIAAQSAQFAGLRQKQREAAAESDKMTDKQRALLTATANLTGEVGLLANSWARVAAEAKAAALEQARAAAYQAKRNFRAAQGDYRDKLDSEFRKAPKPFAERGLGRELLPIDPAKALEDAKKAATAERTLYLNASRNLLDAAGEYERLQKTPLADFKATPAAAAAKDEKAKKAKSAKARKSTGPTAEEIEQKHLEQLSRINQEELQARAALATNATDRADLLQQLLREEYRERLAQIDNDEHFTAEQKKAQKAALEALYGPIDEKPPTDGSIVVKGNRNRGLYGQQVEEDLRDELNRQLNDMLQLEADALDAQAGITDNLDERHKLERRALDLQQEIQRNLLEQAIANGQVADADKARALLAQQQAAAREDQARDQASPLGKYVIDLRKVSANLNDAIEEIAVGQLDGLTSSIANAIASFQSLGDVGAAALRQLTAELIKLALQQIILKTIGETIGKSVDATAAGAESAGQAAAAGSSAATAASAAQAATLAAAWAPAAAAASLATLGGNAGPAIGALIATHAVAAALSLAGGALGRKDGGPITGMGGSREDRTLVAASPGEYMINAMASRQLGRSTLDYINATGRLPARAEGGPVMPALPSGAPSRSGGSGASLSPQFERQLSSMIDRAIRAMPPIHLHPLIDPGSVVSEGLKRPDGRKAFFDTVGANSGKFKSTLD